MPSTESERPKPVHQIQLREYPHTYRSWSSTELAKKVRGGELINLNAWSVKDNHLKYYGDKDCKNEILERTTGRAWNREKDVVTNRCYLWPGGHTQMRKSIEIMYHSRSSLSNHRQ